MDNEICNDVELIGVFTKELEYSHDSFGEKFYKGVLSIRRQSGTYDNIIVMISEYMIPDIYLNRMVKINGDFRSYNDEHRHVRLSVLVKNIELTDEDFSNKIYLRGYICKEPIYRSTPKGRLICDIYLAVNRSYSKSDYIPCICWGRNATKMAGAHIGTLVVLCGRIQSREYIKEEISHTAYEVSVINII